MQCGSWYSCQICPLAYRAAWLKASDSRDFCESSGHTARRLSFCPDCDHFSYDLLLFHPGCWKQRKPSARLNQGAWRLLGHSMPDVRCLSPCSSNTAEVSLRLAPGALAILSIQLLKRVIERALQENYLNHPNYTDVNLPCATNVLPPMRMPLIPKRGYVLGIWGLNG